MDDSSPYSAIDQTELELPRDKTVVDLMLMEPKREELRQCVYWKYGTMFNWSPKRKILGSVVLYVKTDNENVLSIRHVVKIGPSQWIIGRNLTTKCNLEYFGRCVNRQSVINPTDFIKMSKFSQHSHINLQQFLDFNEIHNTKSPSLPLLAATITFHTATTHTLNEYIGWLFAVSLIVYKSTYVDTHHSQI